MTTQELARHYLRYWAPTHPQGMAPTDNAPLALHGIVAKEDGDEYLVWEALSLIANNQVPPDRTTWQALEWFYKEPKALALCNEVLASKKGKKESVTFTEVMELACMDAYLARFHRIKKAVLRELTK
jgi:hypothetical protein